MATKFDFKKSPDVNGTADKTTLYPKIVVAGTKNGSVVILGGLTFVNFPLCIHLC